MAGSSGARRAVVLTLPTARDAIVCRRDQLRLGGLRVPATEVGFGEALDVRLEMPFADQTFVVTGTVVSSASDGAAVHLDPLPGELELFCDMLERAEIEGRPLDRGAMTSLTDMRVSDVDDEESESIEIAIEEESADGAVPFAVDGRGGVRDAFPLDEDDDEDSGYWASLLAEHAPDGEGDLAAQGLAGVMGEFHGGGSSGVLRFTLPDGQLLGVLHGGDPLLLESVPPRDEGNLDLALATASDLDLDRFAAALERQEETGEPLSLALLQTRAIAPDDLLRRMRQEAGALIGALADRTEGRWAFWACQIPLRPDGETVDVLALLRGAQHLLE